MDGKDYVIIIVITVFISLIFTFFGASPFNVSNNEISLPSGYTVDLNINGSVWNVSGNDTFYSKGDVQAMNKLIVGFGYTAYDKFEVMGGNVKVRNAVNPYFLLIDTTNNLETMMQSFDTYGTVGTTKDYPFSLVQNAARYITIISGGNTGFGTTTPQNIADFEGGIVVGSSYSGSNTAPTDGMLVQGWTAFGASSAQYPRDFRGAAYTNEDYMYMRLWPSGTFGNADILKLRGGESTDDNISIAFAGGANKAYARIRGTIIYDDPAGDNSYGGLSLETGGFGTYASSIPVQTAIFIDEKGNSNFSANNITNVDYVFFEGGGWLHYNGSCVVSSNGGCV